MTEKLFKNDNSGMTFIELIVVLGIFGAIASTVLFNYRDFSSNVHLQNLAQDIALQIKKAQTGAVSGALPQLSQNQDPVPLDWKPSYGVAFTTNTNTFAPGGKGFIYYFNQGDETTPRDFEDFVTSYNPPCGSTADSECLEEINITSGEQIDLICFNYVEIEPDDTCTDGTTSDTAFISFTRPRSNAFITDLDNGDPTKANVYIRISSPEGGHKYIEVWQSGYINVK